MLGSKTLLPLGFCAALAGACFSEPGDSCTPGTEGCACTADGTCLQGLECRSNICVDPGGSGTGTTSDDGGSGTTGGSDGGDTTTGGASSSGGTTGGGTGSTQTTGGGTGGTQTTGGGTGGTQTTSDGTSSQDTSSGGTTTATTGGGTTTDTTTTDTTTTDTTTTSTTTTDTTTTGGWTGGIEIGDPTPCLVGGNVMYFDGDPGEWIYAGQLTVTDATWSDTVTGTPPYRIRIHIDPTDSNEGLWWDTEFSTDKLGVPMAEQPYYDAMRIPFEDDGHPGMSVTGDGRGCNTISGEFQIVDLTMNGTTLQSFTATWNQQCDNQSTRLRGCVHYEQ